MWAVWHGRTTIQPMSQPVRLRIAHQLSLLIATTVTLAVLVVGGLTVWNLHSGFVDYLRQRDDAQLMRLVQIVERKAAVDPSFQWLTLNEREAMRMLMDEFNGRTFRPNRLDLGGQPLSQRGPPGRPPPPGAPEEAGQPVGNGPEPRNAGRYHPPPPANASGGALRDRVVIRDATGQWLAGRLPPQGARIATRAIKVQGQEVGFVELTAEPEPDSLDLRFLQRQYTGLAFTAVGTVLLSVLAAWWVAGRWSRPLRALQLASRSIARGQRTQPLEPMGALEIAQLTEDVNTMTSELARLEQARRSWIAQISHELRTPLAVLRGEIESIEDGARQPTPEVMASLRDEVMQLTRLVNDLHTLSVADMGGLQCEFVDGDAHATLFAVVQRFGPQAKRCGLTLSHPAASPTLLPARWDFGRMEQVLANLLTNSLRYTSAPGQVRVQWHTAGPDLVLTVDDSAPGVVAADLPLLFDPLFRVDRSRHRTHTTTNHNADPHASGLGLSIVRTMVQAHGGTVTAGVSALGGLQVRVQVPLMAIKAPA